MEGGNIILFHNLYFFQLILSFTFYYKWNENWLERESSAAAITNHTFAIPHSTTGLLQYKIMNNHFSVLCRKLCLWRGRLYNVYKHTLYIAIHMSKNICRWLISMPKNTYIRYLCAIRILYQYILNNSINNVL